MKNRMTPWLALIALFTLTGVSGCDQGEDLTIFHTNDIHLHLEAAREDAFGLGGLARMHTVLEQRRAVVKNSLLIDAGDFTEGSWAYNLDSGTSMIRLMDMLGYDAVALGNHDFLNGPDRITEALEDAHATFPVLASNLDLTAYSQADRFRKMIPEYVIKNVNGIKVGIIGLTTFELVYDTYIAPVQITNPIDRATALAKILRPQVDVLIISSHNAFEVNLQIAKSVPGVDAVLSGHSHLKISEPTMVENAGRLVPVVEAFKWGKFLGELTLNVNRKTKRVAFKSWDLHALGPEIPDSKPIADAVQAINDRLGRELAGGDPKRQIAHTHFELEKTDQTESALGNLAASAYREATGADLALEQANFTTVGIAAGPVSMMELHDVMPHIFDAKSHKEWTLKLWNARGSDLQLVMTIFYSISSLAPFGNPLGWLLMDNATVVWDPKGSSPNTPSGDHQLPNPIAVRSIQVGGQPLDLQARYRVAISDGFLFAIRRANDLLKLGIDLSQIEDSGIQSSDAIIRYGVNHPEFSLADLDVGQRIIAQSADLSLMSYNVTWDGQQLSVNVRNLGLTASNEGKLICRSGLRDDRLRFGTPQQKWTPIGEATIPPLAPNGTDGNQVVLKMKWDHNELDPGIWPVQCETQVVGDNYVPNNIVETTFRHTVGADGG